MRRLILTLFTLFFINSSYSQTVRDSLTNGTNDTTSLNVRCVLGFVASKANVINGWAIGWLMLGGLDDDNNSATINGLYTNLSPIQVFWGIMLVPRLVFAPFDTKEIQESVNMLDSTLKKPNIINGIALSVVDASDTYKVNGLQISILTHRLYKLYGVSTTIGLSSYYSFKGIMISGLLNVTHTGKGLQIGLINKTNKMTGIQIGLWNQIGKRGLPFINMSFKKKR